MRVTEEMCPCGRPLHYLSDETRAAMQRLVAECGEDIQVRVGNRVWLVPRHYVALHGLSAAELPDLGFPEVPG